MAYWMIIVAYSFNIVNADLAKLSLNGDGYFMPYPGPCESILSDFAHQASNLTLCSIQHARPIRLCKECIDQYVSFSDKYEELLNTIVNGTSCKSVFISHDRLDAILKYHDNILDIWNKGNCNACFDWPERNKPQLSNTTKHFDKMFNVTMECIVENIKPFSNNTEVVCEKCMQYYDQLNNYYDNLSPDSIGLDSICMDVVDSMNATRSIWSKILNCCQLRKSPEVMFLCCTAIISVLPILYYLAVRFCGPIRDLPNVLNQSRFKQTLLGSLRGRIN